MVQSESWIRPSVCPSIYQTLNSDLIFVSHFLLGSSKRSLSTKWMTSSLFSDEVLLLVIDTAPTVLDIDIAVQYPGINSKCT
jgi:hypothetical protein